MRRTLLPALFAGLLYGAFAGPGLAQDKPPTQQEYDRGVTGYIPTKAYAACLDRASANVEIKRCAAAEVDRRRAQFEALLNAYGADLLKIQGPVRNFVRKDLAAAKANHRKWADGYCRMMVLSNAGGSGYSGFYADCVSKFYFDATRQLSARMNR